MTYENTSARHRLLLVLASVSALTLLSACANTGMSGAQYGDRAEKIDSALERAANQAASHGQTGENLALLERLYKRNPQDKTAALNYGAALRQADQLNRASMVLAPFARDDKGSADMKAEYAAVQVAIGNYESAEKYAREAILKDPENYNAFHVLGIALDAQGYHSQAEVAFRKGLDNWQGDPTPIMNNLALNLASQGFLDEASQILQRAAAAAPDRPEIERNLRIVTALQQTQATAGIHRPPLPGKKPEKSM